MSATTRPLRITGVLATTAVLTAAFAAPAAAAPPTPGPATRGTAGPWVLTNWRSVPVGRADQGVATVATRHGSRVVLRGDAVVPRRLRDRGWWHIGDPGSARGYLLDAYQGRTATNAKLYGVTTPSGRHTWWTHRLVAGEKINNSFAAIAPSGRWFVSGEWGRMHRLLIFPMPGVNRLARHGHDLPLVATIRLTKPVRNVQGCTFASPTRLVCSTNDPYHDLFRTPKQLLSIGLSHPVNGRSQAGRPRELGPVPELVGCGPAETEGVDIHNGRLLMTAREPASCGGRAEVFTYRLRSSVLPEAWATRPRGA